VYSGNNDRKRKREKDDHFLVMRNRVVAEGEKHRIWTKRTAGQVRPFTRITLSHILSLTYADDWERG
jgi:hypothetical protein